MVSAINEIRLAILFADVCDSTTLYENLGDIKARETVTHCLTLMAQCTREHGGSVVKTIGDEILATFPTVDAAAYAASDMQERISTNMVVNGKSVAIRVGFHYGSALVDTDDVFGDAVNTAARMAGQAKPGQILTNAATVEHMSAIWQASTRQVDRANVKGKRDKIDLFEVIWRREDMTRASDEEWNPEGLRARLLLHYQGEEIEIDERRPMVVIGRSDDNDLVIKHSLISRMHARLEYRKGNFVLVDQSINGTYVRTREGQERFVRRDIEPLRGSGIIGLGRAMTEESPDAITFCCIDCA